MHCYISGGATFTEVENKAIGYRTRCNVANRNNTLIAPLVYNGLV